MRAVPGATRHFVAQAVIRCALACLATSLLSLRSEAGESVNPCGVGLR